MNYYEILGIGNDCDFVSLKKAYYKQAKLCHPDLFSGNKQKEEKFKQLVNAFDVISDPIKRAAYDQQLFNYTTTDQNITFDVEGFNLNANSIMDSIADDILEELIVGNNIDIEKTSLATLFESLEQTEVFMLYREAKNYFYNYQYKLAMSRFKKLAKITPDNILYRYYLGQCFAKQHCFFKAVKQFRMAINLGKLRIPLQQLFRMKRELKEIIKKQNFLIRTMMKLSEPLEQHSVTHFESDKILIAETEKAMHNILQKDRRQNKLSLNQKNSNKNQKRLK